MQMNAIDTPYVCIPADGQRARNTKEEVYTDYMKQNQRFGRQVGDLLSLRPFLFLVTSFAHTFGILPERNDSCCTPMPLSSSCIAWLTMNISNCGDSLEHLQMAL